MRRLSVVLIVLLAVACDDGGSDPIDPAVDMAERDAAVSPMDDGVPPTDDGVQAMDDGVVSMDDGVQPMDAGVDPDQGVTPDDGPPADMGPPPECLWPEGTGTLTPEVADETGRATLAVEGDPCLRTFSLSTTAELRDGLPASPRRIQERADRPIVRTRNQMFDALYALALDETEECSVDTIRDGAFNDGNGVQCPPGGCFETGRKWNYVWTRDTAYAVHLGLAALDPTRARNSLEFKLAERREGGDRQIVQDTGSGGSYPISTDRVVWALGARALIGWLDGPERDGFIATAYEAMRNTIEHDRIVAYSPELGLYRGEQSFLDWREQSYPAWTAGDVVHIGMSHALGTNVGHHAVLRLTAELAELAGEGEAAQRYGAWATALAQAINDQLWLEDETFYSAYTTTGLDQAPSPRTELLGTALAVLEGVADPARARAAVTGYPHLPKGPPVLWPQQKDIPIYHNRGIWPFVTAYGLRAGMAVDAPAVVDNTAWSLWRGAALNLSNMENFELVTGRPWLEDGDFSGPVVNSQRQLWSVAAWFTLTHQVVFGITAELDGLRVSPYVTTRMREQWFGQTDELVLTGLPWRGATLDVVVHLPAATGEADPAPGAYVLDRLELDGEAVDGDTLARLPEGTHRVDAWLTLSNGSTPDARLVTETGDYRNLFGPVSPGITGLQALESGLRVSWDPNGELPGDVVWEVLRDGQVIATDLPGGTTSFDDPAADAANASPCYVVRARFAGSGNGGQHSPPWCWWGNNGVRVDTLGADQFQAQGGEGVFNHGRFHYQGWGDAGHSLTIPAYTARYTGEHLIQVTFGNGAGSVNTGITCAVKRLRVFDGDQEIAGGYLMMPHLGDWALWEDSNFVAANLQAGRTYRIIIDSDDRHAINMSHFTHFETYTGGQGGRGGVFNRVNIADLKVLARTGAQ